MCGIFGQYLISGANPALIERMAARLAHRGPDGYGTFHSKDGRFAFGAGRLAIIDLSAPAGPIFNEDQSIAVVLNGEIYNYRTLRTELETLGHHFTTKTDTEVIVHGYESWGDGTLERLRGMFALCIYDSDKRRLLLARDRAGEKPLYYSTLDGFLFASEIKTFFEHPAVRPAVNDEMLPVYLTLGYVPPPQTMFKGINKLAPGELLIVEDGKLTEKRRYWQAQMDTTRQRGYHETVQEVRKAVQEAVETRLMSDVPVGAFLSGGLDSTAVVALMAQRTTHPIQTFTVGFDMSNAIGDAKFNVDARFAQIAADHLKTDHHSLTLRIDERLSELLPHLVYSMDEPIAQQSILQTALIAGVARSGGVPVLISGDGGDELFAGYNHYRADRIVERYQQVPNIIRACALKLP